MTETQHKTTPGWAELSDDVLASVEAGRKTAIDAVRKFVDEVTPVIADQSRRKTVIDAALDLAEELGTARIEFLRSVVRIAGETLSKE
jgi:hypothetical protein